MLPALRNRSLLFGLVLGHLSIGSAVDYFGVHWHWWARYGKPLLPADYAVGAALLIILGADLGLLGVWAALADNRQNTKIIASALCLIGWGLIYRVDPFSITFWLHGLRYRWIQWEYYYLQILTACALPALVIFGVAAALVFLGRRGARLERQSRDALNCENAVRHFQVSHLLTVVSVMSALLATSDYFHRALSPQISMRWGYPEDAPMYSAETVLLSALFLIAITLAVAWATLSVGRPWLRLLLALASGALLGTAWAYAFTAPNHLHFLMHNAMFSAGVGVGQTMLIGGVLLLVRRRGYRIVRRANGTD